MAALGVAVTTAWLVSSITSSPPPSAAVTRVRLSIAPASHIPRGTAVQMAISREGSWLAYRGTTLAGDGQLYLRNLAEG